MRQIVRVAATAARRRLARSGSARLARPTHAAPGHGADRAPRTITAGHLHEVTSMSRRVQVSRPAFAPCALPNEWTVGGPEVARRVVNSPLSGPASPLLSTVVVVVRALLRSSDEVTTQEAVMKRMARSSGIVGAVAVVLACAACSDRAEGEPKAARDAGRAASEAAKDAGRRPNGGADCRRRGGQCRPRRRCRGGDDGREGGADGRLARRRRRHQRRHRPQTKTVMLKGKRADAPRRRRSPSRSRSRRPWAIGCRTS